MANLRDRLKRINIQKKENKTADNSEQRKDNREQITSNSEQYFKNLIKCGWQSCGFKVIKRVVKLTASLKTIKKLPLTLQIFIPDLKGHDLPVIENFVFFDLETTGLSGGAGTVAFLAAFGKIVSGKLHITQYLLLDYSGQNDFLENINKEFNNNKNFIVTYNGKSFDSQVLISMCLVNRIKPPDYNHIDLVHPSRRLWKRIINDCSQMSIERNILGINREDDIPGALAPEIWFEFLNTERTDRLIGICDHNVSDISGLAEILSMTIYIAKDPFNEMFNYDIERTALYWRKFIRKNVNSIGNKDLILNGENLLKLAAEKNYPKAVYVYSYEMIKNGNYTEALKYVKKGLKLFEESTEYHNKLLRRKERLDKKMNN